MISDHFPSYKESTLYLPMTCRIRPYVLFFSLISVVLLYFVKYFVFCFTFVFIWFWFLHFFLIWRLHCLKKHACGSRLPQIASQTVPLQFHEFDIPNSHIFIYNSAPPVFNVYISFSFINTTILFTINLLFKSNKAWSLRQLFLSQCWVELLKSDAPTYFK